MSEKFLKMKIQGWRQYKNIDIDFHPNLTIITGPNGTGKSTIISILNRHFGYEKNYLSTPLRKKGGGGHLFSYGIFNWLRGARKSDGQNPKFRKIGELQYSNGASSTIQIQKTHSISYQTRIANQIAISGVHIDSHMPPTIYKPIGNIPTNPITSAAIVGALTSELRQFYISGSSPQGSLFHIKTALISMSIFGHGNQTMEPIPELLDLFKGFQEKLRMILPSSLGFRRLNIRSPEVLLDTKTGEFVVDAASGGIIKLIEVAWQLFFHTENNPESVVTMDEPENHLHPSMQRNFLSNLIRAFPDVQFIVVTHSPFVVSSVRDSSVYVLSYQQTEGISYEDDVSQYIESSNIGDKVVSIKLDTINKASTASEILREALGVASTIPDWAQERLKEVVSEYRGKKISEDILDDLYSRLKSEGLTAEYPTAVTLLAERAE